MGKKCGFATPELILIFFLAVLVVVGFVFLKNRPVEISPEDEFWMKAGCITCV